MDVGISLNNATITNIADNSVMVGTSGEINGEGIKLTPSRLATEIIFNAPLNSTFEVYINFNEYLTITGTGNDACLDEYTLPTDQIISIVTDNLEDVTFTITVQDPAHAQLDYAAEILSYFQEHHIFNADPKNPGRILVESTGKYFRDMEIDIFKNSRGRFLPYAVGKYLDRYGEWFKVPRNDLTDDTYRANIISMISSDITIKGLKEAIAAILNITVDEIDVSNTTPNIARVGSVCTANEQTGVPSHFGGHFSLTKKQIIITIPSGIDTTILRSVINNLVIPGVTVLITDGSSPPT